MNIFEQIRNIDADGIGAVLMAVLDRYNDLFPEWIVSTISVEKSEDRDKQFNDMIRVLTSAKEFLEDTDQQQKLPHETARQ